MKKLIYVVVTFALLSCNNPNKDVVNSTEKYNVIPKPVEMTTENGRFVVSSKTKIVAGEQLQKEAEFLASYIKSISGIELSITSEKVEKNAIHFEILDAVKKDEEYRLSVDYQNVKLVAKNGKGIFYGIQTLKQLLPLKAENSELAIPAVKITDYPRFVYRGMHLDVARHMFPVAFIKKYIDLIALHKMNRFHWHLTEDQGWRIEIKKYPKLTEIGAWRNGTIIGHHPGTGNDGKRYGGFYTQDQVKEIVAYAKERHITVIPEIELPGHSSAAIAAYPELSCFPEKDTPIKKNTPWSGSRKGKQVQQTWGVFDDVYDPSNENTFTFLENVLSEVLELFPSEYIHIGGDECPKTYWKKSRSCQQFMRKNGIKNEHELQSYFIQRIEKFLNSKGRKLIGWDEILEGGLAPNATVMSWRGEKGGIEAAKQHHTVVMTPGTHCYFDHYQSEDRDKEPLAIGGFTSVEKVYSYNPVPKQLNEEQAKYVLGAQGNVWTEYMKDSDYVEYMILPRMTALSEVLWSPDQDRTWDEFKTRLTVFKDRYDAMELNYAKHVFN